MRQLLPPLSGRKLCRSRGRHLLRNRSRCRWRRRARRRGRNTRLGIGPRALPPWRQDSQWRRRRSRGKRHIRALVQLWLLQLLLGLWMLQRLHLRLQQRLHLLLLLRELLRLLLLKLLLLLCELLRLLLLKLLLLLCELLRLLLLVLRGDLCRLLCRLLLCRPLQSTSLSVDRRLSPRRGRLGALPTSNALRTLGSTRRPRLRTLSLYPLLTRRADILRRGLLATPCKRLVT